jgi:hypothetical protein
MSDCNLTANCDGTGDGGCFIDCCNIVCPPENPCAEIILKYYCQPIGACCQPDSQDCYRTTQCQCEANGGTYEGDGSKCEPDNPCAKCVPPCDPNLCLECMPVECTPNPDLATWCTDASSPNNPCGGKPGNWISDLTIENGCGKCVCPCDDCNYVCQNGQCIDVGGGNGNYRTLNDCLSDCGTPFFEGINIQAILRYECKSYCDADLNEVCCFGICCPENSVCCDDGTCCLEGETCCYDEETASYSCCRVGESCCNGSCCPADKPVCCGDGTCCSEGQTCCLDEGSGTYTCCNPGEVCCGGTCCPAGNNCCTESTTSPPYCSPDPCPIPGCMHPGSPSYNPAATCDDGSCRTCCNAGLCVVFDEDNAANCNDVGNGCCDNFCETANDCSPTYNTSPGQLTSCDKDFDGTPFINEYPACTESNDCIQGYLDPNIFSELEKNTENYNNSQVVTYNTEENEVFNQHNLETYQTIKEYDFSMLNSCACVCPDPPSYMGFKLNYKNIKILNAACTENTITITTDYECGLTGEKTVSLAPCCCEGSFDTNTYTVSASSSGDCLEFEWDDTNIKIGEARTITVTINEDCECVFCGAECVPQNSPFIKKIKGNKIKLYSDKQEIQKRINMIKKQIIKNNKKN